MISESLQQGAHTGGPGDDSLGDDMQALSPIADAPVSAGLTVGAIALNLAMKYHDFSTVKDGTLYQQYKLEGKNMTPIHLDMVFDTAMQIEAHLMGASERIANLVFDAITNIRDEEEDLKATPQSEGAGG